MKVVQIITISGLPGSGTTTACDRLCARLDWAYVNAGAVFRGLAQEAGLSLAEFGQRAEADGRIDRQLDERMVAQARVRAPVVVEGRLTGWMAHRHRLAAGKVWLAAAPHVRAGRVAQREGGKAAEVLVGMRRREASEVLRFRAHHGIDIGDLSIYDVVIATDYMRAEAVVERIVAQAFLRRPN